jgi:hypothetical protein
MAALPSSLVQVKSELCPLVLPFRQLLLLLEASFPKRFAAWLGALQGRQQQQAGEEEQSDSDEEASYDEAPAHETNEWVLKEVTFDEWSQRFFPKLNATLKKASGLLTLSLAASDGSAPRRLGACLQRKSVWTL